MVNKPAPKGAVSRLFDRPKEMLADRGLAADDLHTDLRVRDAPGSNPIEATAGGHTEPQLRHVFSDLGSAVQNVIFWYRIAHRNTPSYSGRQPDASLY
jgi:hypothetical protein